MMALTERAEYFLACSSSSATSVKPVANRMEYFARRIHLVSGGARSLESSPFFGVFVQTWTKYPYFSVAQLVAQFAEGFCTVKRRRFNDLGEMKACLQS